MQAYLYGPKFMWNLQCSVGKGGVNSVSSDVSFIQWYYTHAAYFHLTEPTNKAIYRDVRITGACNGTDNDPLVAAILAQQRSMNHPSIDGRVSVVTGSGKVGANAFFLLRLEARFAVMFPNAWPRLDLIPNCPGSVMQASRDAVPNMAELTR
ncbi:MAG: hypothetical protein ABI607_16010 [Betaproteobacteria bacterium]